VKVIKKGAARGKKEGILDDKVKLKMDMEF